MPARQSCHLCDSFHHGCASQTSRACAAQPRIWAQTLMCTAPTRDFVISSHDRVSACSAIMFATCTSRLHHLPFRPLSTHAPGDTSESRRLVVCALKQVETSLVVDGRTLACDISVDTESEVFTVALGKPLGLILAEKDNAIIVEDVVAGGNASRSDVGIMPGDRVKAVTGRILGEKERRVDVLGTGRTKEGIFGQAVLMATDGQTFDSVMAAIGSNRCSQCEIHLVLERSLQT